MTGSAPDAFAAVVARELRAIAEHLRQIDTDQETLIEQDRAQAVRTQRLAQWLAAAKQLRDANDTELAASFEALQQLVGQMGEGVELRAGQIEARLDGLADQVEFGARNGASLTDRVGALEQRPDPAADVRANVEHLSARVATMPAPPDESALRKSLRASLRSTVAREVGKLEVSLARLSPAKAAAAAGGWTPKLRLTNKGTRSLLEVYDWFGGHGEKPQTGWLGATGLVEHDRDATNIRGAEGVAYGGGSGLTREEVLQLIGEIGADESDATDVVVDYIEGSDYLIERKVVDSVESRYSYDAEARPQFKATAPVGSVLTDPVWTVIKSSYDAAGRPVRRYRLSNVAANDPGALPWPA